MNDFLKEDKGFVKCGKELGVKLIDMFLRKS